MEALLERLPADLRRLMTAIDRHHRSDDQSYFDGFDIQSPSGRTAFLTDRLQPLLDGLSESPLPLMALPESDLAAMKSYYETAMANPALHGYRFVLHLWSEEERESAQQVFASIAPAQQWLRVLYALQVLVGRLDYQLPPATLALITDPAKAVIDHLTLARERAVSGFRRTYVDHVHEWNKLKAIYRSLLQVLIKLHIKSRFGDLQKVQQTSLASFDPAGLIANLNALIPQEAYSQLVQPGAMRQATNNIDRAYRQTDPAAWPLVTLGAPINFIVGGIGSLFVPDRYETRYRKKYTSFDAMTALLAGHKARMKQILEASLVLSTDQMILSVFFRRNLDLKLYFDEHFVESYAPLRLFYVKGHPVPFEMPMLFSRGGLRDFLCKSHLILLMVLRLADLRFELRFAGPLDQKAPKSSLFFLQSNGQGPEIEICRDITLAYPAGRDWPTVLKALGVSHRPEVQYFALTLLLTQLDDAGSSQPADALKDWVRRYGCMCFHGDRERYLASYLTASSPAEVASGLYPIALDKTQIYKRAYAYVTGLQQFIFVWLRRQNLAGSSRSMVEQLQNDLAHSSEDVDELEALRQQNEEHVKKIAITKLQMHGIFSVLGLSSEAVIAGEAELQSFEQRLQDNGIYDASGDQLRPSILAYTPSNGVPRYSIESPEEGESLYHSMHRGFRLFGAWVQGGQVRMPVPERHVNQAIGTQQSA